MRGPPLRIALVHPYAWPEVRRGAERYLDDLAGYLAGAGHTVDVVTGTSGGSTVEPGPGGTRLVRRHRWLPRGAGRLGLSEVETFGAAALPSLLGTRYDLVHALTPTGALAGRLARRPTLYTVLGHPHGDQIPTARAQRFLFFSGVRHASMVAALSTASADEVARRLGRHAEVLSPGVRLERFPANTSARRGPPRLLFSASLSDHRKRADLAVAAFALLLESRPDARLTLSGEGDPGWALPGRGPGVDRLRAAIDLPGPGSPDRVPERYRQASVTVLPSEHEAFGLALVESLASGTPVVCAPSGGMPEIVGDARVGRVATAFTAEALARAVSEALTLAEDPKTPGRCVERARHWSWETVGPEHEALYRRVAGR
ncbi:MAG: glycosyltransferase family 4 protein [Acidimicrobiales bacterium]